MNHLCLVDIRLQENQDQDHLLKMSRGGLAVLSLFIIFIFLQHWDDPSVMLYAAWFFILSGSYSATLTNMSGSSHELMGWLFGIHSSPANEQARTCNWLLHLWKHMSFSFTKMESSFSFLTGTTKFWCYAANYLGGFMYLSTCQFWTFCGIWFICNSCHLWTEVYFFSLTYLEKLQH